MHRKASVRGLHRGTEKYGVNIAQSGSRISVNAGAAFVFESNRIIPLRREGIAAVDKIRKGENRP